MHIFFIEMLTKRINGNAIVSEIMQYHKMRSYSGVSDQQLPQQTAEEICKTD